MRTRIEKVTVCGNERYVPMYRRWWQFRWHAYSKLKLGKWIVPYLCYSKTDALLVAEELNSRMKTSGENPLLNETENRPEQVVIA